MKINVIIKKDNTTVWNKEAEILVEKVGLIILSDIEKTLYNIERNLKWEDIK